MHSNTSRIIELFCHKLKKLITHFIQMISLKLLVQLSVIVSGVRGVLHAGLSTSSLNIVIRSTITSLIASSGLVDPIDLASQFSTEFLISSLTDLSFFKNLLINNVGGLVAMDIASNCYFSSSGTTLIIIFISASSDHYLSFVRGLFLF
ncbi:hypothetical protein Tco_0385651 [Tanacetum coccineum]